MKPTKQSLLLELNELRQKAATMHQNVPSVDADGHSNKRTVKLAKQASDSVVRLINELIQEIDTLEDVEHGLPAHIAERLSFMLLLYGSLGVATDAINEAYGPGAGAKINLSPQVQASIQEILDTE